MKPIPKKIFNMLSAADKKKVSKAVNGTPKKRTKAKRKY